MCKKIPVNNQIFHSHIFERSFHRFVWLHIPAGCDRRSARPLGKAAHTLALEEAVWVPTPTCNYSLASCLTACVTPLLSVRNFGRGCDTDENSNKKPNTNYFHERGFCFVWFFKLIKHDFNANINYHVYLFVFFSVEDNFIKTACPFIGWS